MVAALPVVAAWASAGASRGHPGRAEFGRHLARGGRAGVYLARDLLLDRPVALKVLFPEFATDRSFVERFRREARSAANLRAQRRPAPPRDPNAANAPDSLMSGDPARDLHCPSWQLR